MRLTLIALLLAGVVGCDPTPEEPVSEFDVTPEEPVPVDSETALVDAAEQGDAETQYKLGFMYEGSDSVPEDYTEAAKWYRKAAEQGHVTAQWMLGGIYYPGEDEGVPDNDVEAYAWFSVAATNGQEDLMGWLPEVKAKLTPEQLTEGQKRVEELFEQINANKAK